MGPYQFEHFPVHIPEFNPGPYIPISGCCNGSRIRLNVTADEWESLSYGQTPSRLALQVPPSCGWWHVDEREDHYNKRVVVRGQFDCPPNDPSRWGYLPETDFEGTTMGVPAWKKSHLLSLPKELRLEIWKWTLTDPSVPDLVVNIGRDKKEAYKYSATGAIIPRITTWLQPGRNCAIGLGLLSTNQSTYEEALPLLYRSIRFAPADHQGIFPLFLETLSPYARSLIRHVKLHVPRQIYDIDLFGDPAVPLFHWAVTCAQIAKLEGQLRDVEVEGLWTESQLFHEKTKRSILYPLCKIKTKKVFGPNNDEGMESVLMHAKIDLENTTALRRIEATARAAAEISTNVSKDRKGKGKGKIKEHKAETPLRDVVEQPRLQDLESYYPASGITSDLIITRDLSTMAGIDAFERELEEHTSPVMTEQGSADDARTLTEDWDLVSYRSGASTPTDRPPSYLSRWSTESWTDVASTIVETQDLDKDKGIDK